MGRNNKTSLQYFNIDVDIFFDKKVRRLMRKHNDGFDIYLFILSNIYRDKGYYMDFDEDSYFDIADQLRKDESHVKDVVGFCLEIGLFSSDLFRTNGVLTSKGIQNRYVEIIRALKRKVVITPAYDLISSEETAKISEEINHNSEEIAETSEETRKDSEMFGISSDRSKGSKETEVKEMKEVSLSDARASEEERERFYEIFFFKNFQNPDSEVDRFCDNYQASGWIRKNGQKATDRTALARTWTPENPKENPRFPADFLSIWKILYNDAKKRNASAAQMLLIELNKVIITDDKVVLCTKSNLLPEMLEWNMEYFGGFFKKHFAGKKLQYRF